MEGTGEPAFQQTATNPHRVERRGRHNDPAVDESLLQRAVTAVPFYNRLLPRQCYRENA